MEGLLWKWTNYWSGWQPRWFILDNGILSYYNSQDEVGKGCKGSVKMSVCDVMVDHSDVTRLELAIPGEQRFYLKAANPKERQQWLVALGSCKASLQTMSDPASYLSESDFSKLNTGVKQKRSELKIYCDLLMQQVHDIKEASQADPVDTEKVEQCSVLLKETCDTFINTLEDCMKLVDKPNKPLTPTKDVISVLNPSAPVNPGMKHLPRTPSNERMPKSILRKPRRSISQSSTDTDAESVIMHKNSPNPPLPLSQDKSTQEKQTARIHSLSSNNNQLTETEADMHAIKNGHMSNLPDQSDIESRATEKAPSAIITDSQEEATQSVDFFSNMGASFKSIADSVDDGVPTKPFLACAAELAKVFDKLSAAAFAPVKNDILGNVRKIEQKWTTDPKGFATLQKIVDYEIKNKQHLDPNSATCALLWLTRGLLFVAGILQHLPNESSLVTCISLSYEATLKPFHNFVVRGVVSIAMRAVPYKETFIRSMADDPTVDLTDESVMNSIMRNMTEYQAAVKKVCAPLITFYREHNMIVVEAGSDS